VLLTALSDLEVEGEEEDGSLWHMRYPLADGTGHVVVATTRPETMLGDTAVAVNPEDERYRSLVGKTLRLPLAERLIPVIADAYVDPEFGSGVVKITPAHDFNDYEIGLRHGLPQINIFTPRAVLNETVPARFRGLDRFEARKRVVAELEAAGLIERIEKHRLKVPKGDRTGAVLEPYLTDQWYVKIAPLAAPALEAVESGRTRFVPENWAKTYYEWMRNIKDWCVSRQLWWGHRIPAWYDSSDRVYVGRSEAEVRSRHGLGESVTLRQDTDVLDTWFSSALWPFSTLGWPRQAPELAAFYPTSVLITGFDIIFFWVARMMMMGLKFMGDVPFRDVYITGLILDEHGEKMSKSKGNVIDPLDIVDGIDLESLVLKRTSGLMQPQLAPAVDKATRKQYPQGIEPHGTDALRFTFAALASSGREIRFDLGRVGGYRNFCNKLWNAARFVLTQMQETAPAPSGDPPGGELSVADRWIRARFGRTVTAVETAFADYRFDYAAQALYEFTWYEFCDWYIELAKPVLQADNASPGAKLGTRRTLLEILEALQRALHPLMPFVTEEIWQRVAPLAGKSGPTVMLAPYPRAADFPPDDQAESEIGWVQAVIRAVLQIRGEINIPQSRRIPLLLQGASAQDKTHAEMFRPYLERLAALERITVLEPGASVPQAAAAVVGDLTLLVPMAGLIDVAAEIERLSKVLTKANQDLAKMRARLANESFVRNAPADVVAKDREREAELERTLTGLSAQLERLRGLLEE
jgi:valyl-tRNA synthetase